MFVLAMHPFYDIMKFKMNTFDFLYNYLHVMCITAHVLGV